MDLAGLEEALEVIEEIQCTLPDVTVPAEQARAYRAVLACCSSDGTPSPEDIQRAIQHFREEISLQSPACCNRLSLCVLK